MIGDGPSYDDLATVVSCCIAIRTPQRIRDLAGLPRERTESALAHLRRRDLVRDREGGRVATRQRTCGGGCDRSARRLDGVYVDPETLRWFCPACWDADVERVAAIVGRAG
jgi:hypothetical protein